MTTDVEAIIAFLDNYLEQSGEATIDPVTANRMLETKGLLKDSQHRPGLPLRNLLRDGNLPHAYQPEGRGTRWFIPHSRP